MFSLPTPDPTQRPLARYRWRIARPHLSVNAGGRSDGARLGPRHRLAADLLGAYRIPPNWPADSIASYLAEYRYRPKQTLCRTARCRRIAIAKTRKTRSTSTQREDCRPLPIDRPLRQPSSLIALRRIFFIYERPLASLNGPFDTPPTIPYGT